ncbi:MAG: hypothetical protein IPK85_02210 [Gemmatimonadetes bacterium]|nr:hypothetical protein [Gemmatimonadota bacterium]
MPRIFSTKTIYDDDAAATGSAYELDYRDDLGECTRAVVAAMNASDSLAIQVSIDDTTYVTAATLTGTTAASALIAGPWRYIRVIKTGTNANATVKVNG